MLEKCTIFVYLRFATLKKLLARGVIMQKFLFFFAVTYITFLKKRSKNKECLAYNRVFFPIWCLMLIFFFTFSLSNVFHDTYPYPWFFYKNLSSSCIRHSFVLTFSTQLHSFLIFLWWFLETAYLRFRNSIPEVCA